MPEVTVHNELSRSPEDVWDFVKDMNNWAPMLSGYVSHTIESDTKSRWTLQGDAGVMTRTVVLEVNITEWNGPKRVRFTLTGHGEAVEGSGTFEIQAAEAPGTAAQEVSALTPAMPWWHRFVAWLSRLLVPKSHTPAAAPRAGPAASRLVYRLRIDALGPTAPMVNAMLAPWVEQSTQDLAARIVAHLEDGPPPDQ